MRRIFASVLIVAASVGLLTSGAQSAPAIPGPTGGEWLSSWNCETTSETPLYAPMPSATTAAAPTPLPNPLPERDTMERLGLWVHGIARPTGSDPVPFYDYYIGYDRARQRSIYIEIDPFEGKYFVGTSPVRFDDHAFRSINHSTWSIEYPSPQGSYTFDETRTQFSIGFTNLTRVCTRAPEQAAEATPGLQMACSTQTTSNVLDGGVANTLTIARMQSNEAWWQGVGKDAAGNVIYEYNIFTVAGQWVAVAVNATTGAYFIAQSWKSPNVGDTTWTIVYPTLMDGFSFAHVAFHGTLPTAFDLIFADGIQHCQI